MTTKRIENEIAAFFPSDDSQAAYARFLRARKHWQKHYRDYIASLPMHPPENNPEAFSVSGEAYALLCDGVDSADELHPTVREQLCILADISEEHEGILNEVFGECAEYTLADVYTCMARPGLERRRDVLRAELLQLENDLREVDDAEPYTQLVPVRAETYEYLTEAREHISAVDAPTDLCFAAYHALDLAMGINAGEPHGFFAADPETAHLNPMLGASKCAVSP